MLRIGQASVFLGVCRKTLRRWELRGKIRCLRTVRGHRRYNLNELERVKNGRKRINNRTRYTALYVRVSTYDQKKHGDLDRQIELGEKYCKMKKYNLKYVFSDIASGLNGKRRGLWKLLHLISSGRITRIILSYRDRLTRFGYEYLKFYANNYSCDIIEIQERKNKSVQEELVEDLISIVTSFSGKIHGMRSWKNKKSALSISQ